MTIKLTPAQLVGMYTLSESHKKCQKPINRPLKIDCNKITTQIKPLSE